MSYIIKQLSHMFISAIVLKLGLNYGTVHKFIMDVLRMGHVAVNLEKLCTVIEIVKIYTNAKGER